ncbi:melanoma inhibitory activity protein 2 isoform X2 [Ictalurus furcatus]|uniref:melanoma inhibitory activity protein 2 isoform X2 n=1 Tax=Ictalurus furcatus TaxID=66913 RepID=UPI00235078EA|nr:melanoma inhibitory activity protein 2 isoform X2 [Ictalurus furcatus]
MAAVLNFILVQFILSLVLQSSGLMSDYKTCGDDACARQMCRVQALRDHHAQDCRFLSFKKGDMIDVYYKLTRKRSDLWAGSTDKQFGYFPKDAVKIDEVFVDEKKEIEMRTQKTDFFCMDAFGTIIASDEEFEDQSSEFGDQTAESEELDPSRTECVSETCVSTTENTPISEQDMGQDNNMDNNTDNSSSINDSDSLMSKSLSNDQEVVTDKSQILDDEDQKSTLHPDTNIITEEFLEPEESQNEGVLHLYTIFVAEFTSTVFTYMVKESERVKQAIFKVVMSLPDDIRPGPDLYGLPWEAVIFTATLGLFTFLLFTCRFVQAIKSRLYCSKERRMGQKVAELLEEKCKVLETLSECEHKFKKLETVLQNGGLSAQDSEREDLEAMSKKLEEANAQMKSDMEKMQEELDMQDQLRKRQEEQLTKLEEMLKKLEEEAMEHKSQLEQDKTTLKIHEMNTERLQKKLQEVKEENSMLLESKAQLEQEAEGWKERLSELEEEKRMSETSHDGMMENCLNKDERIKSLTECLLKMRDWDSEEESAANDTSGSENKNSSDLRQKQKVQKLISAAKMSADLKAMEEDKGRVFAKLTDEIKAKEDLQASLEQLQHEKESLESESSMYSSEIEKLQHKLQIMSEMYQENELKLHRMLTVEEKERSQKEEQLNKAGKKISLATDELNSYRQRSKELEEELEKTNQAYRNQIAAHEKKAHDNWLAARAADRDLTDVKRENSVLRQRLTDWQFKLELMEKNPQARAPQFRVNPPGERSPFGPSPLGRPPSETRPFLSPPTLMDGPPRVSPQFPMMPGGRVPPGGVEGDRSISYSESGSPTWERERERERRSLGPPGPDPGLMYRRPLSAPFLRAPLPPEAYYNEKSDSAFGGEGAGFRENGIRDSGRTMPGADIRPGPLPPPSFPPFDPRDPHFPRRGYRPDFFRPPLAMRGPPPPLPPGVFPRIPLPPRMAFPPMRPLADHVSSEPPSRPSPPGSEQPPEQLPSAHDVI